MGLKMDVKSINQSQMDYVLYGLCPIAYSRRYKGLKGHAMCVCMRRITYMYKHLCVSVPNE